MLINRLLFTICHRIGPNTRFDYVRLPACIIVFKIHYNITFELNTDRPFEKAQLLVVA